MAYSEALVETWALYGAGSLLIFLRIFCRWRMVGFPGFDHDDYIIFFSWVVYTIMTYAADVCDRHADLHTLTLQERLLMSEEEAAPYIHVTRWFCAGVATYVVFIWSLKFNMLFFFRRVVKGLWVEKFIFPVILLVTTTFVINMGILFGSCRPYSKMWVFYKDEGALCEPQATMYMLPGLIMNILTDLCIMAIPAPVVLPAKTTMLRKILLLFLFSSGIFVMVAAILRVTEVLVEANGSTAAIWSCREDFVAIFVGQAPILRPALRKRFWTGETEISTYASGSKGISKSGMPISGHSAHDAFEMSKNRRREHDYNVTIMSTKDNQTGSDSDLAGHTVPRGITVNTFVDIESESVVRGEMHAHHQHAHAMSRDY